MRAGVIINRGTYTCVRCESAYRRDDKSRTLHTSFLQPTAAVLAVFPQPREDRFADARRNALHEVDRAAELGVEFVYFRLDSLTIRCRVMSVLLLFLLSTGTERWNSAAAPRRLILFALFWSFSFVWASHLPLSPVSDRREDLPPTTVWEKFRRRCSLLAPVLVGLRLLYRECIALQNVRQQALATRIGARTLLHSCVLKVCTCVAHVFITRMTMKS